MLCCHKIYLKHFIIHPQILVIEFYKNIICNNYNDHSAVVKNRLDISKVLDLIPATDSNINVIVFRWVPLNHFGFRSWKVLFKYYIVNIIYYYTRIIQHREREREQSDISWYIYMFSSFVLYSCIVLDGNNYFNLNQ